MTIQLKRAGLRTILMPVLLILRACGYAGPARVGAELLAFVSLTAGGAKRRILGTSTKVELSKGVNVLTAVMYASPAKESGFNLCQWATSACEAACLGHSSGRLAMATAKISRICKAVWFKLFRDHFLAQLDIEIEALARKAERLGMVAAIRLNGSTDILWERFGVPQRHPTVQMYDYTKAPLSARQNLPANYHVLFSVSERPESLVEALRWIDAGRNAAVVVGDLERTKEGAKRVAAAICERGTWEGRPAITGDAHDARHLDRPGAFLVLYAKGAAIIETAGFVWRYAIA